MDSATLIPTHELRWNQEDTGAVPTLQQRFIHSGQAGAFWRDVPKVSNGVTLARMDSLHIDAGWKAGLGLNKLQVERILVAALAAMPPEDDAKATPSMRPIPITAAKRIAKEYGYDQVLIYARRCHDTPEPHGEHMTTYGRDREHCDVAARIGDTLKKFMGWEV